MVKIVGHGILNKFSRELYIDVPLTLKELVKLVGIGEELMKDIVFVRGSIRIDGDELIKDGDEIHLFVAMCGG